MKKKLLALIMVLSLIFAMTAVGCSSSSDADSSDNVSNTETEAPEDSADVSSEEEVAVDETEEETTDVSEEETPEDETSVHDPYTSEDITDEMMEKLYASIKDSVTTEYLEANNVDPSDFIWPDVNASDWNYFYEDLQSRYAAELSLGLDFYFPDSSSHTSGTNKEILEAAFAGVMNFFTESEPYESEFFNEIFQLISSDRTLITTNITFD